MYPEPTMVQNRDSSPVVAFISDEDMDSNTESESESSWFGPQNQLGLETGENYGSRWDDEEEAMDEEGEIKHYEIITKY